MISMLRQTLTCHWSARRIQRYLDADPSAPLTPGEVTRLEKHVAVCERCGEALSSHRMLQRALTRLSPQTAVDPATVDRLRTVLDDLTDGRSA